MVQSKRCRYVELPREILREYHSAIAEGRVQAPLPERLKSVESLPEPLKNEAKSVESCSERLPNLLLLRTGAGGRVDAH
eukprot:symbB.v1.2.033150.t2/scaffold4078.1/size45081/6